MMQTLLTPITPPVSGETSVLTSQARRDDAPVPGEEKAGFADLMTQYQQGEQVAPSRGDRAEGVARTDGADKSLQPQMEQAGAEMAAGLASAGRQESDAKPGKAVAHGQDGEEAVKGDALDDGALALNALAGHPFLAHLQDSLKQDTRLVSPSGSSAPGEGNMLPPAPGLEETSAASTSDTPGAPLAAHRGQHDAADEAQAEAGEGDSKLVAALMERGAEQGRKILPAGALPSMDEALQGDEGTTPVTEPARKPDASTPAQAFAVGSQLAQQGGPLPGSVPPDVSGRGQPADKPQDRTPSAVDADGSVSQGAAAKAGGDSQTTLTQSAPGQAASSTPVAPTLVVPQQVLAQAQSQGSQAPVTSLPQGASAATIEGAAASVKNEPVTKGKLAALERSGSLVTSGQKGESDPAPPSPHQGPQALAEARVSQTALSQPRADAPALPHLKLAGQDAPAELQQRVNVMLADKLQQAEIQLDPLGLGKMKIQIQLGQDSQASVSFVVQHGQTREMLEQAMPRLREMLAGQGIQLGQTSVQQQTQQQAQQQSQQQTQGFAGQGGHGQPGREGGHGAQHEAENGVTRLSLSMDAANESGIDFYA
ncbi:flagellar hook-length control protein FliK [Aeromonas sp. BIGb0405]|uniref:flagellar hook-length control protein FliK n=1 Tax=Aeromonas sp. BIGb0405 TaxID=2940592 RepID=UPI002169FB77|nr:flagellar hook-length control protein FliK [Aeromonas sp. BIGb0405]MCS3455331.1 flagellar hook-length control protein FliK [Aeromonas sp. BIGb0405]